MEEKGQRKEKQIEKGAHPTQTSDPRGAGEAKPGRVGAS